MSKANRPTWKTGKFGDYISLLTDYHANGSYQMLKANVTLLNSDDYAVMIRTTNFEKHDFYEDLKYIDKHAYDFLAKSKVSPGDILMNKIANAGSIYLMPDLHRPVSLAMNLFLIRTLPAKADQLFAYYYLKAHENYVKSFAVGTATNTITKEAVRNLEVTFPPLRIQSRIASILNAYDLSIENNISRIRVLETIGHTIWNEWFPQKMSSGSRECGMLDACEWRFISENVPQYIGERRYYATADVQGIEIQGEGVVVSFENRPSRAQKYPVANSVWFARMKDTYKVLCIADGNAAEATEWLLSSGFAGFEAHAPWLSYLYFTIKSAYFHRLKDQYCTGATQMSLTNEGLAQIKVMVPALTAVARFEDAARPLINQIILLQRINRKLKQIKDLLIPKLISGEVSVEQFEAEAVAQGV